MASMIRLALPTSARSLATADAGKGGLGVRLRQAALLDLPVEHLGDVVLGRLRGARLLVVGDDAHAALRRHLHDAAAHRAGADHADGDIGCVGIERHGRVSRHCVVAQALVARVLSRYHANSTTHSRSMAMAIPACWPR